MQTLRTTLITLAALAAAVTIWMLTAPSASARTAAIAVLDLPASPPGPSLGRSAAANLENLAGHLVAASAPATGYLDPEGNDDALRPWTRAGLDVATAEAPPTGAVADHRFAAWYTGPSSARDAVASMYLAHVEGCLAYRERESRRLHGRETPVVVSLHANELNADRLGELLTILEARGYDLVPVTQARSAAAAEGPGARGESHLSATDNPCSERHFEAHWKPRLDALHAAAP